MAFYIFDAFDQGFGDKIFWYYVHANPQVANRFGGFGSDSVDANPFQLTDVLLDSFESFGKKPHAIDAGEYQSIVLREVVQRIVQG